MPDSPSPAPLVPTSPSSDERTWALVAHGLTFFEGGVFGPLIVYVLKKDESDFVAFHALQSLLFGLIAMVIILPVAILTCGMGLVLLLPYFVYEIIASVKAYEGEWYMLPIAGDYAAGRHPPPVDR